MADRLTQMVFALVVFSTTLLLAPRAAHAAFPLPHLSEVERGATMAIDGTWLLTSNSKRIRIEAGRAYVLDGWAHLFVMPVEPDRVMLTDIVYIGDGGFAGDDLPLDGKFNAKIQPDGDLLFTVIPARTASNASVSRAR